MLWKETYRVIFKQFSKEEKGKIVEDKRQRQDKDKKVSLHKEEMPFDFQRFIITPIYKGGSRDLTKNHRPIALTPHMINGNKYLQRIYTNSPKHVKKWTIRSKASDLAILSFPASARSSNNKIFEELEKLNIADVVYFYIAKAFDKVDHYILLNRLKKIRVSGKIFVWIHTFLSNRQQCTCCRQ